MKEIERIRERFLKDTSSVRLGNLAANLSRIVSFSQDSKNSKVVESLLEESKNFIEWMATDYELQVQSELIELQIKLALWHLQWHSILADSQKLSKVRNEIEKLSKRLINLSGLLGQKE